jgi:hypothetical protein
MPIVSDLLIIKVKGDTEIGHFFITETGISSYPCELLL